MCSLFNYPQSSPVGSACPYSWSRFYPAVYVWKRPPLYWPKIFYYVIIKNRVPTLSTGCRCNPLAYLQCCHPVKIQPLRKETAFSDMIMVSVCPLLYQIIESLEPNGLCRYGISQYTQISTPSPHTQAPDLLLYGVSEQVPGRRCQVVHSIGYSLAALTS